MGITWFILVDNHDSAMGLNQPPQNGNWGALWLTNCHTATPMHNNHWAKAAGPGQHYRNAMVQLTAWSVFWRLKLSLASSEIPKWWYGRIIILK